MKPSFSRQRPSRTPHVSLAQAANRVSVRALRTPRGRAWRSGILFALCATLVAAAAFADSSSKEAMQSLDEQVQEIKTDVLSIAAELGNLEEKLLYPSDTQVAVFVSLAQDDPMQLDSVQIQIDGEPAARHIYSFKELEALRKGGVQRIYTGNVRTGEHRLEVSVAGQLRGRAFEASESFSFTKEVEPKLVGITIDSQESGDAKIALGGW